MKKLTILKKIHISLFVIILIIVPLFWFIITKVDKNFEDMINFDLEEKRNKAELVDVTIDNFQTKIEDYYNDRLPFRSFLIVTYRTVNNSLERIYDNNIEPVLLNIKKELDKNKQPTEEELEQMRLKEALEKEDVLDEGYTLMDNAVAKYYKNKFGGIDEYEVDQSFYPFKLAEEQVILGRDNWLFLNATLANYTGAKNIKEDNIAKYIKPFTKLKQKCDELGKQLLFVVVPDKNEVYYDYMPTVEIVDPIERVQRINNYVVENTDLDYIYMKKELLKYKKKFRLYYKYDSHYNKLGAYIVARKIFDKLGIEQPEFGYKDISYIDHNIGDLLLLGNIDGNTYPPDKEFTINYKPEIISEKSETGLKNEDGTDLISIYSSNANTGRKLFYVGDSYRYNIMEYLSKNYDESVFADRSQTYNESCKKMIKEADTIIIESVGRFEEIIAVTMAEMVYAVLNSK